MTVHPHERAAIPNNLADRMRPHPFNPDPDAIGYCMCRLGPDHAHHQRIRVQLSAVVYNVADGQVAETLVRDEVLLTAALT